MKLRSMKKLAITMSLVLGASVLAGCGNSGAEGTTAGEGGTSLPSTTTNKLKVGVVQLVEHDALDAAYKGFVDALAEEGFVDGENIDIDYNNAQNEQANCQTIASKLVNDKSDLILAIATPAAQAVANETKDIPILVTAVTDPADAKLVNSNEEPGTNVSGTSDLTPCEAQMNLLKELFPDAKKVAMLYTSSETNSIFQVNMAKAAAEALGMETVDATVSNTNEIQQVVQSLTNKVDAIYTPTDNLIAKAMSTVSMVANEAGIPVVVGESGMVQNGGLITIGISYYELGKQTGVMAAKILRGEAEPATMPIEYANISDVVEINEETAKTLGVEIPQSIRDKVQE